MDSLNKSPNVFEYLNPLLYLQDYYKYRKSRQKNFSYQFWADELQMNSRSFLRLLVSGKKKISSRFIEAFSRLNFASITEEKYFQYMVLHNQAISIRERQDFSQKMLQILRTEHGSKVIGEEKAFISDPFLPRLLSLLCFSDVKATVQFCSQVMSIAPDLIQQGLETLLEMKLVKKIEVDEESVWIAISDSFHVPDSYGSFNLIQFHKKSLLEAIQAFEKPKELRRYRSFLIPLSEKDLEQFNKNLEIFVSEQFNQYNLKLALDRYLYQVNINYYPITTKMTDKVNESEL